MCSSDLISLILSSVWGDGACGDGGIADSEVMIRLRILGNERVMGKEEFKGNMQKEPPKNK